jgi:hypothetical protein
VQKDAHLIDLLFEPDPYSNVYLVANIGVDTADNEPLKIRLIFQLRDLIFADPPRPSGPVTAELATRTARKSTWKNFA